MQATCAPWFSAGDVACHITGKAAFLDGRFFCLQIGVDSLWDAGD